MLEGVPISPREEKQISVADAPTLVNKSARVGISAPNPLESPVVAIMPGDSDKPRIALGADHAGFHAKETIKKFLEQSGYSVDDVGTWSEESVDYPDYARAVAERVLSGQDTFGIVACGTGIGVSMTANKIPGIRAALAHDSLTARLAREHNDANVLTLGGRIVGDGEAIEIVKAFLEAQFAGGRHQRRVDKINDLDQARARK